MPFAVVVLGLLINIAGQIPRGYSLKNGSRAAAAAYVCINVFSVALMACGAVWLLFSLP